MIDEEIFNGEYNELDFQASNNISKEEKNYYINIINNCKDICDSDNEVNNERKCKLVSLYFNKENDVITVSGYLKLSTENRTIYAYIFNKNNKIIVDMQITRLGDIKENKQYTVLDIFTINKKSVKRKSQYNYDMKNLEDVIELEKKKGR